jgi:hypothetical protein
MLCPVQTSFLSLCSKASQTLSVGQTQQNGYQVSIQAFIQFKIAKKSFEGWFQNFAGFLASYRTILIPVEELLTTQCKSSTTPLQRGNTFATSGSHSVPSVDKIRN